MPTEMKMLADEDNKTLGRKLKSKEQSTLPQLPRKKKKRQQADSGETGQDKSSLSNTTDQNIRPKLSVLYRAMICADDEEHKEKRSLHRNTTSVNSESSAASTVSSIESMLEARRENPEEILLALGFGGGRYLGQNFGVRNGYEPSDCDLLARIPGRFFEQPSSAKGIDLRDMLEARETLLMARQSK